MIFAVAALMLHFGPAVPAMPAAAAAAAKAAAPAPTISTTSLPDALLPSNLAPSATAPAQPAGPSLSQTTQHTMPVLHASLDSAGNDTGALSSIHIPDPNFKPVTRVGVESVPSRKTWLMLSIAQHSAATFDAYSTRRALDNGAREADPLMRPFAGSPAIYAAIQVFPVVCNYTARKMQRSQNNFVRHTWWLPQTVGTGVYLFSGAHNMQVAGQR
jgi:hypothetical protein